MIIISAKKIIYVSAWSVTIWSFPLWRWRPYLLRWGQTSKTTHNTNARTHKYILHSSVCGVFIVIRIYLMYAYVFRFHCYHSHKCLILFWTFYSLHVLYITQRFLFLQITKSQTQQHFSYSTGIEYVCKHKRLTIRQLS